MADGYYLLNTDGAMQNTGRRTADDPPGEASIAVVLKQIKNGREATVDCFSGSIGPATNDVAEYKALIAGLEYALSLGVTHIRAFMDSEFIVEQINGRARVTQPDLKSHHECVLSLADRFAPGVGFRLAWIPRERNAEADALASAALPR